MNTFIAGAFVLLQRLLPRYWLTSLVHRIARIRRPAVKDFLIRNFVGLYKVEIDDVDGRIPDDYRDFNAFFIRELKPSARPIDDAANGIVSPVDGTVSQAGTIAAEHLIQAKGITYTLSDLLATDTGDAALYQDGVFATIYLAPYNYHRVHIPFSAQLTALRYVPGDLFSVNTKTVAALDGLFARNERVVCQFETAAGPALLVLVGALNVGTINTIWTGDLRPRKKGVVDAIDLRQVDAPLTLEKGQVLGWFNMGSTVILVAPAGLTGGLVDLQPGATVRMGQAIGTLNV